MILKPHQQEIVDMNPARALVPDGTGTGKTLIGISLADRNCATCLVVTIKDNVEKWKRDVDSFSNKACEFTIISKENFKKLASTLDSFEGVIIDEVHHFAGTKSQISKAFRSWLKKYNIKYRWLMSATPVTANWLSVFVLAGHLGFELNYYKFMKFFFYELNMGGRRVWKQNNNKEKELQNMVRKLACGRMVTMEDVAVVPEQTFITEYFELTEEQKIAIENIDETQYIVRWTKTHQIEQGISVGNEYEEAKSYQCLKNDRILELTTKHKKIAIFARYNHQLVVLEQLLAHLKRQIFIINGENKDRDKTVREIEKSESCIVLINTMCGTGYELPSIGTVVFASLSFSYLDFEQSKGRFLRIAFLHKNTYYILVTRGGVDSDVYKCINNKRSFYIDLYKNENQK